MQQSLIIFVILMAKTDIEDAFHFIPINPLNYHLIGFIWQGEFYFDLTIHIKGCKYMHNVNKMLVESVLDKSRVT